MGPKFGSTPTLPLSFARPLSKTTEPLPLVLPGTRVSQVRVWIGKVSDVRKKVPGECEGPGPPVSRVRTFCDPVTHTAPSPPRDPPRTGWRSSSRPHVRLRSPSGSNRSGRGPLSNLHGPHANLFPVSRVDEPSRPKTSGVLTVVWFSLSLSNRYCDLIL